MSRECLHSVQFYLPTNTGGQCLCSSLFRQQCYLLICHNLISPSSSIGRPTAAAGTSVSHSVARCLASSVFYIIGFSAIMAKFAIFPFPRYIGGHVCGKQPRYCVKRCSRSRRRRCHSLTYQTSQLAMLNKAPFEMKRAPAQRRKIFTSILKFTNFIP